jgi:hypothetical protein
LLTEKVIIRVLVFTIRFIAIILAAVLYAGISLIINIRKSLE